MSKMFDFDLEIIDIEKDLLFVQEKMEPLFNFIDLSFQLLDGPVDEKVASLIRKLTALREYYDRKATLNNSHSETIIDLFRICARKDIVLSQALEGDFTGFIFDEDEKQAPEPEPETDMDTTNVEPQSRTMEVASQSKFDWLCNKKVMMSNFEATLDALVGNGQCIIQEFIDWESSGPTYDFNELRNALCGEAKLCFNADHMYLFGLAYTGRDSKKIWTSRTIELVGIEYQKHPDSLDKLLDFDKNAVAFYFQQSLSINEINKETQSIDRKAHCWK